jgi:prepilin-type N-terminal cleavage/methylation domain-containing protein
MKRGFTLVEILVSLFILAGGILIVFNLFPLGFQSLAFSRKLNEVSLLTQKKFEEIKSQEVIELGVKSGKEGDLNWSLTSKPLELAEGIEVINVELDIDFDFLGKPHRQRFITYLSTDE